MAKLTEDQIGRELSTVFGPPVQNDEYFLDFCKIGSFLTDIERTKDQLRAIETAMSSDLPAPSFYNIVRHLGTNNSNIASFTNYLNRTDRSLGKKDPWSHLLVRTLQKIEATAGFSPESYTYFGFVSPSDFTRVVQSGSPFKDPGAGSQHGEYTHRLQWAMIANSRILSTSDLQRASRVYKRIGDHFYPMRNNLSLWDALVDRLADANQFAAQDEDDFRNPNKMHPWIITNGNTVCPLLQTFLSMRTTKRDKYDSEDVVCEYICKRKYNMSYNDVMQRYKMDKNKNDLRRLANVALNRGLKNINPNFQLYIAMSPGPDLNVNVNRGQVEVTNSLTSEMLLRFAHKDRSDAILPSSQQQHNK